MKIMPKVFKIGIAKNNGQPIKEIDYINLIAGKGIVGDRFFCDENESRSQLTLIEKEKIDIYNEKFKLNLDYLDFRRNIITQNIELNYFVNKKLKIGEAVLLGIDLCRPCRHLQELIGQENVIKEFLRSGGLRCQIIKSGKIKLNDNLHY
tara:strand:- start:3 stop:452 length:450 start_codon:yes stop_codon:yes gene_type:complete